VADGQPALAITDLSNLFGAIKFYKEARAKGRQTHHWGRDFSGRPGQGDAGALFRRAWCCWCSNLFGAIKFYSRAI
jgi:DNA polymerase III alpha subunit